MSFSFPGLSSHHHYAKMPKKANIFESFSHSAIQQFKEAFGIMDADKDGLLSASDLVAAFGAHGKSIGSGDAQVIIILVTTLVLMERSLFLLSRRDQSSPQLSSNRQF